MLRRVAFKPKVPERRPARQYEGVSPDAPRKPPARVEPAITIVVPVPKADPLRSEDYRRFVASFPCFDCGALGYSQAAHENVDKGMAMKVDDRRTFPLCGPRFGLMGCHYQFDNYIERTREECRELGRRWVERMQQLARERGRREFS